MAPNVAFGNVVIIMGQLIIFRGKKSYNTTRLSNRNMLKCLEILHLWKIELLTLGAIFILCKGKGVGGWYS